MLERSIAEWGSEGLGNRNEGEFSGDRDRGEDGGGGGRRARVAVVEVTGERGEGRLNGIYHQWVAEDFPIGPVGCCGDSFLEEGPG